MNASATTSSDARLRDKRVAIIATDGFEQSELTEPLRALRQAGADVDVIAPKPGRIQGFHHTEKGDAVVVDESLADADPDAYDALVLPGGLFNPDRLRIDEDALAFARAVAEAGKPVAAICHGPWILADAGLVEGRRMTSVPTIRRDIENAGASWVDEAVVVDGALITSRTPRDLDAFNAKLIDAVAATEHASAA